MPPKMATAGQTQADMYAMKTAIAESPLVGKTMGGGWSNCVGTSVTLCSTAPEAKSFTAGNLGIGN